MRARHVLRLVQRDLRANRGRAIVSAAGIAFGVSVLMVIVGLGLGAREVVLDEIVRTLPVDTIEVVPRRVSLGLFELGADALFGSTALNEDTRRRLEKVPGVAEAFPKMEVPLPMGARGGARLFGRPLYTDLFMTGLPRELVAPEVGDAFADQPDLVPVVISDQLLEIYNASVAPALGTPRLTAEILKGFEFEMVFGRSLMLGQRGARTQGSERARIVGVSRYAIRLGVTVPLETAERLLDKYGDPEVRQRPLAAILLRAERPEDVGHITQAVKAAGLTVDETAQRTGDILMAITALSSLIGVLVLTLAALNIAHSFLATLNERKRELAVLRAVGARQLDLVVLVLVQAAMVGLLGGLAGIVLAYGGAQTMDWAAEMLLPTFPFKPESFFVLPLWLSGISLIAAVGAALLGAFWPAFRAARTSVARSLSEI